MMIQGTRFTRLVLVAQLVLVFAISHGQTFNPTPGGYLPDGEGGALLHYGMEMDVKGNYVYIAAYGENALEIVDISNPNAPVHAAAIVDGEGGAHLNSPESVFVLGNYAYVGTLFGLEIINISDPLHPVHAGYLAPGPSSTDPFLTLCHDVYVVGNYAYVASGHNALVIVDISNPSSPVHVGSAYGGVGGAVLSDAFSVYVQGNYAYVASNIGQRVEIFNISNPASPTLVGDLTNGEGGASLGQPNDIIVDGNYAYVSCSNPIAIEIMNVSNPANPTHVSTVAGVGGIYTSLRKWNNYVFVTMGSMYYVDVSNPAAPVANFFDPQGAITAVNTRGLAVQGDYAYIAGFTPGGVSTIYLRTPLAPTTQAASAVGQTSATINWTGNVPATNYYLDVSTASNFSSFVTGFNNLQLGNVTSLALTNLLPGTTYHYRLRVTNSFGTSYNSGTQSFLTIPQNPTALDGGNRTASSFLARWNATDAATGYFLDVSTSSTFTTFVTDYQNKSVGNVTQITVSGSGITVGTTYYYRLRAANATGATGNSNVISISTAPPVPVATTATNITSSSATVNWNESVTATHYFVQISSNGFVNFTQEIATAPALSHTFFSLTPATNYAFRVIAYTIYNQTSPSTPVNFTTGPSAPEMNDHTDVTTNSFVAHWVASPTATHYFFDLSTTQAFTTFVAGFENLPVGNVTNFTANGLADNTLYFYRVRAANANAVSTSGNIRAVVTQPLPPVAVAPQSSGTISFLASWQYKPGLNYWIDVSTTSDFSTFITDHDNRNVGGYNGAVPISGVNSATRYFYRFRGSSSSGTTANSNVIAMVTDPQVNFAGPVGETSFTINWSAGGPGSNFFLDVSTTDDFATRLPGYDNLNVGTATSQAVTGLTRNTTYYYRLRATVDNVTSENSEVNTVTTKRQPQTITFNSLTSKKLLDAPFTIQATASSGNAVTFTSSDPNVATITNGNTVTITGRGTTQITASQAGDNTFEPTSVIRELQVVNVVPVATSSIGDQNVTEDEDFSFGFGATFFQDGDNDVMTYTATLDNGTALPLWINLNSATRTFSGTGEVVGNYPIKLMANDGFGGVGIANFTLKINVVMGVDATLDNSVVVFPNPVERTMFVTSGSAIHSFTMYNGTGQVIVHRERPSAEGIDISHCAPGLYVARVRTETGMKVVKVLKK